MPRVSERQRQLRFLKGKIELNIVFASSSSDNDSMNNKSTTNDDLCDRENSSTIELLLSSNSEAEGDPYELEGSPLHLLELYYVMDNTRYFTDRTKTMKSKDFVLNFFENLLVKIFRKMTRMDKPSFFKLVELIDEHPIFQNDSAYDQAHVAWQLAVCQDRLGHDGNGACLNHLIPTWGVSNGSLCNFTSRCFTALDSALHGVLKWPGKEERKKILEQFAKKGFPGCVGLIDGTLIPLSQQLKDSCECYYDQKCRYSMNAQVICDHRQKILFLYIGLPGTVSDLTCFKRTNLYRDMDDGTLFEPDQFLLGDSGYGAMTHMVCAYRHADTAIDKENFNFCVVKARVTNEHCIGVLKSRWHSLKEMRIQLNGPKHHLWLVRWIGICAKLHNFVLLQNDEWTEEDAEIIIEGDSDAKQYVPRSSGRPTVRDGTPTSGESMQARVFRHALHFHKQPGGCLAER